MDKKKYKLLVKKHTPKEESFKHALKAFIFGGLMGILSQGIFDIFHSVLKMSKPVSSTWMMIIFIFIACLLTALGIFDKLVNIFYSALIIPITGFAHSVTSASLDYKKDGLITGVGSNCFKLAGSVILYGVLSAFILALIGAIIYG